MKGKGSYPPACSKFVSEMFQEFQEKSGISKMVDYNIPHPS